MITNVYVVLYDHHGDDPDCTIISVHKSHEAAKQVCWTCCQESLDELEVEATEQAFGDTFATYSTEESETTWSVVKRRVQP